MTSEVDAYAKEFRALLEKEKQIIRLISILSNPDLVKSVQKAAEKDQEGTYQRLVDCLMKHEISSTREVMQYLFQTNKRSQGDLFEYACLAMEIPQDRADAIEAELQLCFPGSKNGLPTRRSLEKILEENYEACLLFLEQGYHPYIVALLIGKVYGVTCKYTSFNQTWQLVKRNKHVGLRR